MSEFADYLEKLASMDDDGLRFEIVNCRRVLAEFDGKFIIAREVGLTMSMLDPLVALSLTARTRLRLAERALSRREVSTYGVCATGTVRCDW